MGDGRWSSKVGIAEDVAGGGSAWVGHGEQIEGCLRLVDRIILEERDHLGPVTPGEARDHQERVFPVIGEESLAERIEGLACNPPSVPGCDESLHVRRIIDEVAMIIDRVEMCDKLPDVLESADLHLRRVGLPVDREVLQLEDLGCQEGTNWDQPAALALGITHEFSHLSD
jgi:hypothetical protein